MGLFPLKALNHFWVIKFSTLHNPALCRRKKKKNLNQKIKKSQKNLSSWQITQLVGYANQTGNIDATLYFACLPPANIPAGNFWAYNKTCVWLSLPICTKQLFNIQMEHLPNIWRKNRDKCDAKRAEVGATVTTAASDYQSIFPINFLHLNKLQSKALSLELNQPAPQHLIQSPKWFENQKKKQINIFYPVKQWEFV